LEQAGYTEAEVCRRLGIGTLDRFEEQEDREQVTAWDADACGVLIRLFVEGRYVDLGILNEKLGEDCVQALAAMRLLEHEPADERQIASIGALYPTAGVWILSDRWNRPDRSPMHPGADVVYAAIVSTAQRFLRMMPRRQCSRFLDLCSGTAVAALRAARQYAEHAWAFDIADRSTLFGQFNARLNGLNNVTCATGNLYEPAAGARFDYIVAHPPYVPVLRPKWIYHDGGEDGEQIMRQVVEGLPQHLEPGGLFYMLVTGSDREQPFEQRLRSWLGTSAPDFDIALFPYRVFDPEDFIQRVVVKSRTPVEDAKQFRKIFRSLNLQSMVYGAILMQRHAEPREPFTVRRQLVSDSGPAAMMWLMDWETKTHAEGGQDFVLRSKLRANPAVEMRVTHKLSEEGWTVTSYQLISGQPFSMEAAIDPWAAHLLGAADGTLTTDHLFTALQQHGIFAPETSRAEFARAVSYLVSGGFLLAGE
jgi:methylase of polypeptide subunit release factors